MSIFYKKFVFQFSLLFISFATFGQSSGTFSNSTPISTEPNSPDYQYPSEITVTGMPDYITILAVNLMNTSHEHDFAELDILLETPSGEQFLLLSDASHPGDSQWVSNLRFRSTASLSFDTLNPPTGQNLKPTNFGSPDDFGPIGVVDQPYPSFFTIINANPNGVWKLYVWDDTANEFHGQLPNGWSLGITSNINPICPQPEVPVVDAVQDTSVLISWLPYDVDSTWEIVYDIAPFAPDFNTTPTIENISNSTQFRIDGLEYDTNYDLYIRTACGGSLNSDWVGPLNFTSGPVICKEALDFEVCQELYFSYEAGYYLDYYLVTCPEFNEVQIQWIGDFTPPADGEYFLNTEFELDNILFRQEPQYCTPDDWACLVVGDQKDNISLGLLSADTTYQILFEDYFHFTAFISSCETPVNVQMDSVEAIFFEAKTYFSENGALLNGQFDVYLTPEGTPKPTADSIPFYADYQVVEGLIEFPANTLEDDFDYEIYIRQNCDLGTGCWLGPFAFSTFEYCGGPPESVSFVPRSISADLVLANTELDVDFTLISFGTAPFGPPAPNDPGNSNTYGGYSLLDDSIVITLLDLEPNTDYQVYLKRRCVSGGQALYLQPWYGPYNFSTNSDCFVEVEDLYCGQCYTEYPNYGYNYYSTPAFCNSYTVPSRGEKIFRIQHPTSGEVTLKREQSFTSNGNTIIYQLYLKSASEICDLNNWEEIGCWRPGGGSGNITINVEEDSVYYLMIDFRTESTFQPYYNRFRVQGPDCYNPCPPVEELTSVSIDAQSVLLSWDPVDGAIGYDIAVIGVGGNPMDLDCHPNSLAFRATGHPDTNFLLEGLSMDESYNAVVRARCAENNVGSWQALTIQAQPINEFHFSNAGTLNYCSPFYQRMVDSELTYFSYDALEFRVDQTGTYTFDQQMAGGTYIAIYEEQFDPANPTNQLLFETQTDIDNPASVQFSQFLESDKTYLVVSSRADQSMPDTQLDLTISSTDGNVISEGYLFLGQRTGPAGIIPPTNGSFYTSDRVCVDSGGWRHYYQTDGTDLNPAQDLLLFSLKDYPEIYNGDQEDTLILGGTSGVSVIPYTEENYVQNPGGWLVMSRYWNLLISDEQQPTTPLAIRYYYTQEDFDALAAALPPDSSLVQEDLYFYKINDENETYNTDPGAGHVNIPAALNCAGDGLWEYENGLVADTSHWSFGEYEAAFFAEMVVHRFSGGGAGVGSPTAFVTANHGLHAVLAPKWHLYPVPAENEIIVEAASHNLFIEKIQIFNAAGKLIIDENVLGQPSKTSLNINWIPSGLYFVKIFSSGESGIMRMIKE